MVDTSIIEKHVEDYIGYVPETGVFTWKRDKGKVKKGDKAGTLSHGYIAIRFNNKLYLAHRLAWFLHYGKHPTGEIDHVNGDRSDNRIENLRDVDRCVNQQNQRKAQVTNKCGLLGVSKRSDSRYVARISVGGVALHLGSFTTADDAHTAYINAKHRIHVGGTI